MSHYTLVTHQCQALFYYFFLFLPTNFWIALRLFNNIAVLISLAIFISPDIQLSMTHYNRLTRKCQALFYSPLKANAVILIATNAINVAVMVACSLPLKVGPTFA